MGIGKKIGGIFKKGKKRVSNPIDEAKKAINKVRDTGRDTVRDVQKQVDAIEDKAERRLFDLAGRIEKDIAEDAKNAKRALTSTATDLTHKIEDFAEEAVNEVIDTAKELVTELALAEGMILAHEVASAAYAGMDKWAKREPEMVDEINKLFIYVDILGFKMTWENFYSRGQEIVRLTKKYSDNPPSYKRQDIMA